MAPGMANMSDPVGHSAVPLPGLNPVLSGKVKTVQVLAAEPSQVCVSDLMCSPVAPIGFPGPS